jgi:hypothetical protein
MLIRTFNILIFLFLWFIPTIILFFINKDIALGFLIGIALTQIEKKIIIKYGDKLE